MAQQTEPPSLPLPSMDLPYSTSTVFFKIGSNLDPFVPPAEFGDEAGWMTISFEPIVGCKITPHKQPMLCWIPPRQRQVACMSKIILASRHPSPRLQSRFSGIQDKIMERCMLCPYSRFNRLSKRWTPHVKMPFIKTDTCRFTTLQPYPRQLLTIANYK